MRRNRRGPSVLVHVAFWAVLAGCSHGPRLRGQVEGVRQVLAQAERNGAYACAPRELALGRAHADFAEAELAQGDAVRAAQHLRIAEPNAHAALRLSPPARCAPRGVTRLRKMPGDRDGDGILDDDDQCPDDPEDFDAFEDEDGCPDDQDTDADGLVDSRDLCVLEPEDSDGYLDGDGCPDPDNDLDRVLDPQDRCPNEPEDPDGFSDEDGCPDPDNDSDSLTDDVDQCPNEPGPESEQGCPKVYKDVEVTAEAIRIRQKIHFEFDKAVIRPISYPILDTVAQVLKDFPSIRVEVQGHTDSRGGDAYNERLSQRRAEAVQQYLIQQGISPMRLAARGYGESRPIESNRTSEGRAANRRVEFIRMDVVQPVIPGTPGTEFAQ